MKLGQIIKGLAVTLFWFVAVTLVVISVVGELILMDPRDKASSETQLGILVGYLAWWAILGVMLFFVGRRLYRDAP